MRRKYTELDVEVLFRELREFYDIQASLGYVERQYKAHKILDTAVRYGILQRPRICSNCNLKARRTLHGHHSNYKYPLKVKWLCHKCHRGVHKGEKSKVRRE